MDKEENSAQQSNELLDVKFSLYPRDNFVKGNHVFHLYEQPDQVFRANPLISLFVSSLPFISLLQRAKIPKLKI